MPRFRLIVPAIALTLFLAGCTLASRPTLPTSELLTPAVLPTLTADGENAPLQLPDAGVGSAIYTEKCAACHGPAGKGDGPRAEQIRVQGKTVANLVDPSRQRAAVPRTWHDVISNGRIQNLMPGFSGSLNAQQRWDVQSHVWALGTTTQTLMTGSELYAQQCASCHGAQGETTFGPANLKLQSPNFLAEKALLDIAGGMVRGDAHKDVKLDDAQRFAVADYTRALNYVFVDPAQQQVARVSGDGTLIITATNGTPNGGSANGLPVLLRAYDQTSEVLSRTAMVSNAGVATFSELPRREDYFYQAELDFNDGRFYGPPMQFISTTQTISEVLRVFETTTDAKDISIGEMHFFVQEIGEGTATIVEFYIFNNASDRAYIGEPAAGGRRHALRISVPKDAQNIRFDGLGLDQRFFREGDVIYDTEVVVPGQSAQQITLIYEVPYRNQRAFERQVFYPVANWDVLVPENAGAGDPLKVIGLEDKGVQQTPNGNLSLFAGQPVNANDALKWTLSGQPLGAPAQGADARAIGIGLIAFGVAVGMAYFLLSRARAVQKQVVSPVAERDLLLRQIALLDDAFAQGKMKEADYAARRAELKEQLRDVWDE
jgi:mono/diheme cytochrome c family protein